MVRQANEGECVQLLIFKVKEFINHAVTQEAGSLFWCQDGHYN